MPFLSSRHVFALEVVAFWSMVIDHVAKAGVWAMPGWELIGRLAFPLFVVAFAHNVVTYQRCNWRKLVLIGLLAMPAMPVVFGFPLWWPNVMFTFVVGWSVWRYFREPHGPVAGVALAVGLLAVIVWLSLGPSYDIRGMAMVALALTAFSVRRWWLVVVLWCLFFFCFLLTLLGNESVMWPVSLLLLAVVGGLWLLPPGVVVRHQSAGRFVWWSRAGFGKWYVIHLYLLAGVKWLVA